MRKLSHIGLVTLCLPLLMGAEVYRWVDENGVVNFTQLKPRGVRAEQLTTTGGATKVVAESDAVAAPPADGADPLAGLSDDQQAMLKDLRAAEQARQDEVDRIRAENCDKARGVLSRLSASARIRVREDDGGERVMGEDERQRRIAEAQRGVAENCTS